MSENEIKQALTRLVDRAQAGTPSYGGEPNQAEADAATVQAYVLDEWPFGFTWADVDALRLAAAHADRAEDPRAYDLHDLATRIAALLPPRTET